MLDERQRITIFELARQGMSARRIARALGVSRTAVRNVIASGRTEVPMLARAELGEPYREQILELYADCKGNLVRVHEELVKDGAELSYQALTAFCRRHEIGHTPPKPSGRYDFTPGEEMQHDTSPHRAKLGGKWRAIQTASLVLCYSRMRFVQFYPSFTRFECKVFLTDALEYFGGACGRCMVDNTSVIRLKGTGKDMVPVPEMVFFGERFGFTFAAHEVGDANRSARVEAPFNHVDNNFLAGRKFHDWTDLNEQGRVWCDKVNAAYCRELHGSRRDLFATERVALRPLPDFVPEVYVLHQRIVDAEGYVSVRRNRYGVPYQLIGRPMEVRESKARIDVFDGPRLVVSHPRSIDPDETVRVVRPEHRPPRGEGRPKRGPSPEETELLLAEPALAGYVSALKKHVLGRGVRGMQKLLRMVREYPSDAVHRAIADAEAFGLYELDRLERMILRHIAHDYFLLPDLEPPIDPDDDDDQEDDDE